MNNARNFYNRIRRNPATVGIAPENTNNMIMSELEHITLNNRLRRENENMRANLVQNLIDSRNIPPGVGGKIFNMVFEDHEYDEAE